MAQFIAKIWFHSGSNKVLVKQCHFSDHSTRAVSHRASMGKKKWLIFLSKASREHSVCLKQICMSMREGNSFPTSKVDKVILCCFSSPSSWQKQNLKYLKQAQGWFCTNNSRVSDPILWMQWDLKQHPVGLELAGHVLSHQSLCYVFPAWSIVPCGEED